MKRGEHKMTNGKRLIKKICIGGLFCFAFALCVVSIALKASAVEQTVSSITIEIDYGNYDGKDLPEGKVGMSYPVFSCVASDNNGNDVSNVRITVRNPENKIIPQKNGRFDTDEIGSYSVEYVAVSGAMSAAKTISINVTEYTDSLRYDATGENVPVSGETGSTVFAVFGSYSGGVGDLTEKKSLTFCGETIALNENENGVYFIPEKCGEYTLTYGVTDFVGDEKTVIKNIEIADPENPVLTMPSLPASAIGGETLVLPLVEGILYENGAKYYQPVRVYFDDAEITKQMQVENLSVGSHTIRYVCQNPTDADKKTEYSFGLTVKDRKQESGARLFDNYFDFENCEPATGENKEYQVRINGGTENATFAFSRELPVSYLNFDLSAAQTGGTAYSELYFVLTDSINAQDCVKVKIKRLSSYEHLWLSYDNESKTIVNADNGETIAKIGCYADGRSFTGFKSGKAYISFEVKGVKKDINIGLKKVASNVITTDLNDYASPVFLPNADFKSIYVSYIGHTVNLPELQAFDLLDKTVSVTLRVYDQEGTTIYDGKGGYTLTVDKSGEYMVEYIAVDENGNRKLQQSTIYVTDFESPVIKVSGIKSSVKVGEEITLPAAEISDNETAADKITSYVYVIKGNNRKTLIGGTYKFTDAGEYRIRYVAYDAHQNYTVVEFTVTCR